MKPKIPILKKIEQPKKERTSQLVTTALLYCLDTPFLLFGCLYIFSTFNVGVGFRHSWLYLFLFLFYFYFQKPKHYKHFENLFTMQLYSLPKLGYTMKPFKPVERILSRRLRFSRIEPQTDTGH
jgi:hypothetical protein